MTSSKSCGRQASCKAMMPRHVAAWRVSVLLVSSLLLLTVALGGCIKERMFDNVRLQDVEPELVLPVASDTVFPDQFVKKDHYCYDAQGTLCGFCNMELRLPVSVFTSEHFVPALEGVSISCTTPTAGEGFYGPLPFNQKLQSIAFSNLTLLVTPQSGSASNITLGGQTVRTGQATYDTITFQCQPVEDGGITSVRLTASEPCTVVFSQYAEALFAISNPTSLPSSLFTIPRLNLPVDLFKDKLYANFLLDHSELRLILHRKGLLRRMELRAAFFNTQIHAPQVPADYNGTQKATETTTTTLTTTPASSDPLKLGFNANATPPGELIYSVIRPTQEDSVVLAANADNSNIVEAIQHGPANITIDHIRFYPQAPQGPNGLVSLYARGSASSGLSDMLDLKVCFWIPIRGIINDMLYSSKIDVSLPTDLSNDTYQLDPDDQITIHLQFINGTPLGAHVQAALLKPDSTISSLGPLDFGHDLTLHDLCSYFDNSTPQMLFQAAYAAGITGEDANGLNRHTVSLTMSYKKYLAIANEIAALRLLYHFNSPNKQKVRVKKGDKLTVRLGLEAQPNMQKLNL